jgi:hypothetical protein
MEDIAIKFEAQLVSASMTVAGGHKIVLRINPEDILDNPHNSSEKDRDVSRVRSLMLQQPNTRFACALVQLESESDQPVEPQDIKRAKKVSSVISMLCRTDARNFSRWLIENKFGGERSFFDPDLLDEQVCLYILKDLAKFESRSDLKKNPKAVAKLEEILNEYRFE